MAQEAGDINLAAAGDLGLAPLVAEFINDFVDPQHRTVFIVEAGETLDPEMVVNWEDFPLQYVSSFVDVFSNAADARACVRKLMADELFKSLAYDDVSEAEMEAHGLGSSASWADFFKGTPGASEAVRALRKGKEGAEAAIDFPWKEEPRAGTSLVFKACIGDLGRAFDSIDDAVYYGCSEDWGHHYTIRASLVK